MIRTSRVQEAQSFAPRPIFALPPSDVNAAIERIVSEAVADSSIALHQGLSRMALCKTFRVLAFRVRLPVLMIKGKQCGTNGRQLRSKAVGTLKAIQGDRL
eukprot:372884-Amphidinium_carterae.2